jgi:ankyrin repeat protein
MRLIEMVCRAAWEGDLAEVQRLMEGEDPELLDDWDDRFVKTPLMCASFKGHLGVVRWLLDKGAAVNAEAVPGCTALYDACSYGHLPVVRLLLERGADPTIAAVLGITPLMAASSHLKVVRLLLDHPRAKATINQRDKDGETALWWACRWGRGGMARMLLQSGADPTIVDNYGRTPMAIAKQVADDHDISEGCRECVAALEVRPRPSLFVHLHLLMRSAG